MSDEKFEVAFSGEIADGADLEQVKVRVGQMFKADASKLAHLFSGKRVVIKKDIDHQTAEKYRTALNKAGALCEVKNTSVGAAQNVAALAPAETTNMQVTATGSPEGAPSAPNTDPLHISADQIEDISMTVAPVGSDVQDEIKQVSEADVDISGMDMAPVGSDLLDKKEEELPAQPDTTGLKIVD